MELHPQIDPGEFFYRFFRKRTSSFHASIYKAGITAVDEDIHKARVDLKKVFALFNFFEMLGAAGFDLKKNASLFRNIFKQAGKIRENQLNIQYIEQLASTVPGIKMFFRFLKKEQKKNTRAFISAVIQFDEKKLKNVSKTIKKCCSEINAETITSRSKDFLIEKARKIQSLAGHPEDPDNVHKVRQELKKLGAIVSLLHQVSQDQNLEPLIAKLTATEVLIGEWHDHVILVGSLDRFFKSETRIDEVSLNPLRELKEKIESENTRRLGSVIPMVIEVVGMILPDTPQEVTTDPS